jgi:hypothetical protein
MSYLYIAKCQRAVEEKGCRRIDCTGLKIFIPGWLFHECFKIKGLRPRLPSNVNHSQKLQNPWVVIIYYYLFLI